MDKKIIYKLIQEQTFESMRQMITVCGGGDFIKAYPVMIEMGLVRVYDEFGNLYRLLDTLLKNLEREANE